MSTNSAKNILFEALGDPNQGVGLVTFNRPKVLNALNRETLEDLGAVLDDVKNSSVLKVLVLTGAGEKAFVAGADISQFPKLSSEEALAFAKFGQAVFHKLSELSQPTIAAVNGFALGGGCELASACDFIYASEKAKFGQPEVRLGIIPGYGGTQRFVRQVGKAMGKELLFSGRMISAEEALRIGLVNKVCAAGGLMNEVFKTAREICAQSSLAVGQAKRAIEQGYQKELSEAMAIEAAAFAKTFGTEDQKEGARAFLEKRAPRFTGR